ncbi:MAG: 4-hydroxybenzoate octaprenyltransferase [Rhodospirillales bacterium]|nr:4-hydroxybenzoate octaprenyltransferase [Rhodospirillales bacterium]
MAQTSTTSTSDIPAGDWIDRRLPPVVRPYARLARLDRPIGIWLLMFPGWWGLALAAPGWPDPWFLALFAVGATVMRGAGCVMNDIADRKFDARVARTAGRPLASGAVGMRDAVLLMGGLSFLGLAVLLQFNGFAIIVGASSLVLVAVYPFAKRVTYWPQAVLGLTFNWGALLGWAVVRGELAVPALTLYVAGLFWTLGYDTIYAHQDKEDDILIGVKSTALRFGGATPLWLWGFYATTVLLLALSGALAGMGWPFYLGLTGVAAHFVWQIVRLDIESAHRCLALFKANRWVGLMVFVAIVLGWIGA